MRSLRCFMDLTFVLDVRHICDDMYCTFSFSKGSGSANVDSTYYQIFSHTFLLNNKSCTKDRSSHAKTVPYCGSNPRALFCKTRIEALLRKDRWSKKDWYSSTLHSRRQRTVGTVKVIGAELVQIFIFLLQPLLFIICIPGSASLPFNVPWEIEGLHW